MIEAIIATQPQSDGFEAQWPGRDNASITTVEHMQIGHDDRFIIVAE